MAKGDIELQLYISKKSRGREYNVSIRKFWTCPSFFVTLMRQSKGWDSMKINVVVPPTVKKMDREKKEMVTVYEHEGHTTVWINPSSLSEMQTCWRKTYYSLVLGLQPKEPAQALIFGLAIHAGLEVFYTSMPKNRILNKTVEEFFELLIHNPDMEGHEGNVLVDAIRAFVRTAEPLQALDMHNARSLHAGVWTLKHYFRTYLDDPFVAHEDEDGPMIERRVDYEIYKDSDLTINVFGTIDVVLRNLDTGNIVISDHKTSSRLGPDFYNRLKPNHQYTAYVLGSSKCLGISTNTFVVNGIEVKPYPKTERAAPPKFVRQPTSRSEDDFGEFKQAVIGFVRAFIQRKATEGAEAWELGNTNDCAMWGGCKFLPICSAPTALRDSIIKNNYEANCFATREIK